MAHLPGPSAPGSHAGGRPGSARTAPHPASSTPCAPSTDTRGASSRAGALQGILSPVLRPWPILPILLAAACTRVEHASFAMDQAPMELAGPTTVPLEPLPRPVVGVRLDPARPRPFLVDTGAQISVITAECAAELGLRLGSYSEGFEVQGGGYGTVRFARYVRPERLTIGAMALRRARLSVLDAADLGETEVDGILGQDLWGRLIVAIDEARNALHLVPGSGPDPVRRYVEAAELGVGEWVSVEVPFDPLPVLPMTLGEPPREIELHFETGATRSSLPRSLVESLGSVAVGTAHHGATGGGYGTDVHRIEDLDFLGLGLSGEFSVAPRDRGLIGMDVLGGLVLPFDGPAQTIWMHRRP